MKNIEERARERERILREHAVEEKGKKDRERKIKKQNHAEKKEREMNESLR